MIGEFTRKALERVQSKLERLIEDGFDPEVVCVHAYQPLLKFIHDPSTVPVRLDLPWHMASSDLKSLHIRRYGPHPTFVDEDGVLIWADERLDKAFCDEFHSSIYGCDLPAAEKFERHYIQFYDDSTRKPDTELANRWHAARLELMRTLNGIQPRDWPSLWQGLPEHLATRNKSADGWFDVVFQLGLKAFSGCPVQLSHHYPLNERLGRISDVNPSKRLFCWDDPSPFPGWEFQIENFATASIGAIDWLVTNWPDETQSKPAGQGELTEEADTAGDNSISNDGRSLRWFGETYTFTPLQAAIIKMLYEHFRRGTPVVGGANLLEEAGSSGDKVAHLFRHHPAWKTIITSPTKGSYRLTKPVASLDDGCDAITPQKLP